MLWAREQLLGHRVQRSPGRAQHLFVHLSSYV
jgi:hypothetical protein